jgi:hypothetical protein
MELTAAEMQEMGTKAELERALADLALLEQRVLSQENHGQRRLVAQEVVSAFDPKRTLANVGSIADIRHPYHGIHGCRTGGWEREDRYAYALMRNYLVVNDERKHTFCV